METKTPHFNQLRSNLDRSVSRPKDSGEKKKDASPAPQSGESNKPSGAPRKSWLLNSSEPQTHPFENLKSVENDLDEKPKTNQPEPEDDSRIYSVKDNPYVRGNTPNKTTNRSSLVESKVRKSQDER